MLGFLSGLGGIVVAILGYQQSQEAVDSLSQLGGL
jgi:hypothetical protein